MKTFRLNDSVQFFIEELRARVVAESGIPSDRFHLGKLILRSFKDDPEFIAQINGETGEKETCGSLLKRSIQCANYFKSSLGLGPGDVIVLIAPNHLDIAVPVYAALYLGISIAPGDGSLTIRELEASLKTLSPKLVICECDKILHLTNAVKKSGIDTTVLAFEAGSEYNFLSDMLKRHENDTTIEDFRAEDFDPEETIAILGATSGTTGLPKYICSTHKNLAATGHYIWSHFRNFPTPSRMHLTLSPLRWTSSSFAFVMTPIMRVTRLQTSLVFSVGDAYHIINTYKPTSILLSSLMLTSLIKSEGNEECDFSCFELITCGGGLVPVELIKEVEKRLPDCLVINSYGLTEANFLITFPDSLTPTGSCGTSMRHFDVRLVDIDTNEEITEPNKPGEMLVKGPSVFKGYYKNPEETKKTLEDGWLRTGDVLFRDDNWNFYFVERIKLYLQYNMKKISPIEVESVIIQHPGVLDVAVTGVVDPQCGELVTACVVKRPGSEVTAQEIKDIVKDSLPDTRQLRGGVIFLEKMPLLTTTKLDRRNLRRMVQNMSRE